MHRRKHAGVHIDKRIDIRVDKRIDARVDERIDILIDVHYDALSDIAADRTRLRDIRGRTTIGVVQRITAVLRRDKRSTDRLLAGRIDRSTPGGRRRTTRYGQGAVVSAGHTVTRFIYAETTSGGDVDIRHHYVDVLYLARLRTVSFSLQRNLVLVSVAKNGRIPTQIIAIAATYV